MSAPPANNTNKTTITDPRKPLPGHSSTGCLMQQLLPSSLLCRARAAISVLVSAELCQTGPLPVLGGSSQSIARDVTRLQQVSKGPVAATQGVWPSGRGFRQRNSTPAAPAHAPLRRFSLLPALITAHAACPHWPKHVAPWCMPHLHHLYCNLHPAMPHLHAINIAGCAKQFPTCMYSVSQVMPRRPHCCIGCICASCAARTEPC